MDHILKPTDNFNLINAIYIDWNYYLSNFEKVISSPKFIFDMSFEDKLDIIDSYMQIKNLYNSDNMNEFITFYENNKKLFSKIGELNND